MRSSYKMNKKRRMHGFERLLRHISTPIMSLSNPRDDISSAPPSYTNHNEKDVQDAEKAVPKDPDGADAPELAEMKELRFVRSTPFQSTTTTNVKM